MSKPLVYLDVDRTLYRTDDAAMVVWQLIAAWHPTIDPHVEYKRGVEFRVRGQKGLYYYDFTRHIENCGLDAAATYMALKASPIVDNSLLFPGAIELVSWLKVNSRAALLTYGSDDYQRLKISLCPALQGIPVYTTRQPKAEWLEATEPCWLVDDKPIGDEVPSTVRFIQVSLENREVVAATPWPQYTSLAALQEYLVQQLSV